MAPHRPTHPGHPEGGLVFFLLHLEALVPDDEPVHGLDGLQGRVGVVVTDEAEPARAARDLVDHDAGGDDLPEGGEHLRKGERERGRDGE